MPFWTAVDGTNQDPKRVSRFKVSIEALNDDAGGNIVWYAKAFTKPVASIKTATHRYLNHSFNYPGSVEWNEITIDMIDPTDPIDAAGSLAQLLEAMGYVIPAVGSTLVNISKRKAVASLGEVAVEQIDDQGNPIETWVLNQPIITKIDWGSYKYDGDDLNVLKLSIKYDWATCLIARTENDPIEQVKAFKPTTTTKGFIE